MTREEFIASMLPHALRVSQQTGLDPRLVIAQSALETGWGRSAPNNNYFGIKSHGKAGGGTFKTTEVVNGQPVTITDSFRGYGDMGESADGYADFLQTNKRYGPMLSAQGFDAQLAALGASGYATDPDYTGKVRSIAAGLDLANLPPVGQSPKPQGILGNITGGGGNTMIAGNPQQDTLKPEGWLTQDRKDALIMALEGMTMNPNQALMSAAGGRIQDRRAEAKSNAAKSKTTEWLRSIGRDDLAAAVESGSVDGGTAAGVALTPQEEKGRDTVVVGDNLVDRATGEVVFAPAAQDPSSTVAWLKAQGREDLASGVQSGAIPAADAVKSALNPPSNGITITNPDGTTTQIGGRPGGALTSANQTDAQKAAMAYESLTGGLDAYESLYDTGGGAVIPGKQKDALTGARTALQLQMKELFNLGVLNGPDLDLMNKLLVDATSVENAALDTIGVANLDDRVAANLKQLRETLKGMVAPKIAAMGGGPAAVTTAPLPADGVIRRKFNPATGMIE